MSRPILVILCCALLSAVAATQPPVPTPVAGVVGEIGAGRIMLTTGALATIAPDASVTAADGQPKTVAELKPGDLLELYLYGSMAVKVRLLPCLRKHYPLNAFEPLEGKVAPCTWTQDGREFPKSFRTTGATFRVAACQGIEATVAYEPQPGAGEKVTFRVVGIAEEGQTVLWEREVLPGKAVSLACTVLGYERAILQCLKPDDTPAADQDCVWGDPSLVLRVFDSIPVPPELSTEIARKLSESLGGVDPGPIAIATPLMLGLSDSVGQDLRDACAKALAERFKVAGLVSRKATLPPDEDQYEAAKDVGGKSLLVLRISYAPPGMAVSVHLFTVEDGQQATSFEVRR